MRYVFNSTPLIHLVKAGLAWTLRELEGEKYTVPSVYVEVVEVGKTRGFDDAVVTERLISEGVLVIREPPKELVGLVASHKDIHQGEAEVIALAKEVGGIAIIDDPVAREVSVIHGVEKEGSYGVILRMLCEAKMTRPQAKEALRMLVGSGWRCDVELYEKLLRTMEGF